MLNWTLPWGVTREPVLGRNVVATSQPLAAQAGMRMLQQGGTAADATVAAAAALTVVEPTSNGLGSDAFAMWWQDGMLHGLNASGRAPAALDVDRIVAKGVMPRLGWDAVTVPGAVSGWIELWKAAGRLPLQTCLQPAIDYARDGFPVSPQTGRSWAGAVDRFRNFEHWMNTFAPDGRAPTIGAVCRLPGHARTLEAIAATEGAEFYEGEIAQAIVRAASAQGGAMSMDDLSLHAPLRVDPLKVRYGDVDLHELPPNGQGLAALVAAGILHRLGGPDMDQDDPATLHLQIEAMKLGFKDAHDHVACPDRLNIDPLSLLDAERLDGLAEVIDPCTAQALCAPVGQWSSTVYLACADAEGMAVSFIQSNYEGFGSGVVIPDWGIAMQNRGSGFVLEPGHPNNVQGGARPYHTIIPGFTTQDNAVHMAFGVMGGPMQPQGHLQVLGRCVAGWNPQAALDAPRWRVDGGMRVCVEPQLPMATVDALIAMGHEVTCADERSVAFGGGQVVLRQDETWIGASDCRRDGQALAF
jgi:gamma-glutamyltranspeptidase/glutathione hydrolase